MTRLLLILCLVARVAGAATYYVDYIGGSDASAGTSTGTAWQHCPGDANATGTAAATTPAAGDTINFKGGSVYNGQIAIQYNGSAGNPITLISDEASWGSGRAIADGVHGGTTNGSFILTGYPDTSKGNNIVVSGFEIRNFFTAGLQTLSTGQAPILTNCIVHHIGEWPNDGLNYNGHGYGYKWDNGTMAICVSNALYDLNEVAFYPNGGNGAGGGCILWGNTISNVQDHAWIGLPANGYQLIAFNSIHDQTNVASHDDAFHTEGFYQGPSNALIYCNNRIWNNNSDFFANTTAGVQSGSAYVFNNVMTQTESTDGTAGYFNGILINVNQDEGWSNICIFNNTICFKNSGHGGLEVANRNVAPYYPGTNFLYVNNILYQSQAYTFTNIPSSSANLGPTNVLYPFSGYNAETNFVRGNQLSSSEYNSVYGVIAFANLIPSDPASSDLHLASGSIGIGQGTNLSATFTPTMFSFLPARYQVDPTKDPTGTQRGSTWDIGAFAGSSITPQRIGRVTNLHVGRSIGSQ